MKSLCTIFAIALLVPVANIFATDYPTPQAWVNDYAGVLSPVEAQEINAMLRDFEATDSTQIFVAIMDRVPGGLSLEEYVNELFARWKIGQQNKDNGVLLAIFIGDRKMRIEVGYGLEDRLTDAQSKLIIANEIAPNFKQGRYYDGIRKGVDNLILATRGAYQGSGKTGAIPGGGMQFMDFLTLFVGAIIFMIVLKSLTTKTSRRTRSWTSPSSRSSYRSRSIPSGRGHYHSRPSRRRPPIIIFPRSGGDSSWGSSSRSAGKSFGGGGFDGFSGGGGGTSGGGGASGSW